MEQEHDGWLSFRVAGSRMLLFDLANRCLIRSLDLACAGDHFGDLSNSCLELWCDPPFGTLLMATRGANTNSSKILAWNMVTLLR